MDSLPIDIHSGKLLGWLISRRHCKKDSDLTEIRRKIGEAIKDMPENDRIVQLLAGSYIHYFHCKEIVEILKETEKDTRNIFGSYSSQRMKDWKEILQMYEKDNKYLIEAAQLMQRLIQYDVPAANRQVTRGETGYEDAVRKQADYAKQAEHAVVAYKNELAKMGIKGESVKKEIIELAKQVPVFLEKILDDNKEVMKEILKYFDEFRKYSDKNADDSVPLSFLRQVFEKGCFTYYEFVNGKPPTKIERIEADYVEEEKKDDEIDFGDDDIDFGDDGGEIDFGDEIEIVGDNEKEVIKDEVARGEFSLSVLEHPKSLQKFYFELEGLVAFLCFRYQEESTNHPTDVYLNAIENKAATIASVSSTTIQNWHDKVDTILKEFQSKQRKHLLKARSDPRYLDKLVEDFEKLRLQEQKYKRLGELNVQKQKDCVKMTQDGRKQAETLINALIYLKEEIEKDIGKKYGRECNIIGEIYNVLP